MTARIGLDAYVVDTLMADLVGHDRRPAAFLVYLYLWRRTEGRKPVSVSLREMAESTGLSKRAVQAGVRRLVQRELASVRRASVTAVPEYQVLRPWARRRRARRSAERSLPPG